MLHDGTIPHACKGLKGREVKNALTHPHDRHPDALPDGARARDEDRARLRPVAHQLDGEHLWCVSVWWWRCQSV